ncbi:MAG TPA: hypothetical protein VI316_06100 [Candidatus Dormibacteraeota bacterium]
MTELLSAAVEVRRDATGALLAVRLPPGGWRAVERTLCRWMVETDWWGQAVHRDYRRCLLAGGDCVELACDLVTGAWRVARRYD